MKPYDRHELVLWGVWAGALAAGFVELEKRGMRRRRDGVPTLTAAVSRYIPGWLAYAAFGAFRGWLSWHFDAAYESWRRGRPPDIPR